MAVSKHRRKNKKKSQGKKNMRKLLQEGMSNFIEAHKEISQYHLSISSLINAYYTQYEWDVNTPVEVVGKTNEMVENVEKGLIQSHMLLAECFNEHTAVQQNLIANGISDADANWRYIEITQKIFNHIAPFVFQAIATIEQALKVKVNAVNEG